jgi:hypothetical protein
MNMRFRNHAALPHFSCGPWPPRSLLEKKLIAQFRYGIQECAIPFYRRVSRDALAAERRRMPMVRIDRKYVFIARTGKVGFLDLFEARRQLILSTLCPPRGSMVGQRRAALDVRCSSTRSATFGRACAAQHQTNFSST